MSLSVKTAAAVLTAALLDAFAHRDFSERPLTQDEIPVVDALWRGCYTSNGKYDKELVVKFHDIFLVERPALESEELKAILDNAQKWCHSWEKLCDAPEKKHAEKKPEKKGDEEEPPVETANAEPDADGNEGEGDDDLSDDDLIGEAERAIA